MENLKSYEPLFAIQLYADLTLLDDETLQVFFEWKDMQHLIEFPIEPAPERKQELWKQTCFEVFLRPKIGIGYFEINISPNGSWNVYHFTHYRMPQPPTEASAEWVDFKKEKQKISARFKIKDADLTLIEASLCAVLRLKNGTTTFWSTKHAVHKPDFHHPDSLTLERKSP